MLYRKRRKEIELVNIQRHIQNNVINVYVPNNCNVNECDSFRNVYDTMSYFKKWKHTNGELIDTENSSQRLQNEEKEENEEYDLIYRKEVQPKLESLNEYFDKMNLFT